MWAMVDSAAGPEDWTLHARTTDDRKLHLYRNEVMCWIMTCYPFWCWINLGNVKIYLHFLSLTNTETEQDWVSPLLTHWWYRSTSFTMPWRWFSSPVRTLARHMCGSSGGTKVLHRTAASRMGSTTYRRMLCVFIIAAHCCGVVTSAFP